MLTFTSYKTWISSEMPRIAYLTNLDRYLIYSCVVMLLFWCGESIGIQYFCRGYEVDPLDLTTWCYAVDRILGLVYFATVTVVHVGIFAKTRLRYDPSDKPYPTSPDDRFLSCPHHHQPRCRRRASRACLMWTRCRTYCTSSLVSVPHLTAPRLGR